MAQDDARFVISQPISLVFAAIEVHYEFSVVLNQTLVVGALTPQL